MATIYIGSARIDENGSISGGSAGDQKQTSTPDYLGEVSMQEMYTHSKGWYIIRPKTATLANSLAERMTAACNNPYLGYDQNNRDGVIKYGIDTKTKTECDCSSLGRECVKEASGKDPGDFTTSNERTVLLATGLFDDIGAYTSQSKTPVYNGDILVTKTKGHTVIVVSGNKRSDESSQTVSKTATDYAASFDKSIAGTYAVTASMLNVRNGAGTSKSIMISIPKGTKVKNYGYYTTVSGTKWLYIQFTYNGVKYTGFSSGKYLQKQ